MGIDVRERSNGFFSRAIPYNAYATTGTAADLATSGIVYVGSSGDVNLTLVSGDSVLFSNVPDGTWLPVEAQRISSSATTATLFVVCY